LKILLFTFYYKPDLCAGSFRAAALVEQLKKLPNIEIEIVTTMPNRYASFDQEALVFEKLGNVEIHRIELPSHKSGMVDQVKSFFAYFKAARKLAAKTECDLVFATSSRLFTAFLGANVAKKKCLPLYLDIRDIFVDTLKDVLNPKVTIFLKPALKLVENYTFSAAQHINLVSKGFEDYFVNRFKSANYSWFTNGIDTEFLSTSARIESSQSEPSLLTVLYAGNIGEGQGLSIIIPELAKLAGDKYQFKIFGDGGRKSTLVELCKPISNVFFYPPVTREQLIREYSNADILFLHLNSYSAFEKVLPSKLFEYAAMGKPILAGVSGYAAKFISSKVSNSAVFNPGDCRQAVRLLEGLELGQTNRDSFIDKYTRTNIMTEMANSVITYGEKR